MTFVVYFLVMFSNGSVVIDTMPVDSQQSCMSIVKMVNSQPSQGGRRVKAACYISTKTHLTLIRRAKVPPEVIDYLKEPSNVINDNELVSFILMWLLFSFVAGISWQLAFG